MLGLQRGSKYDSYLATCVGLLCDFEARGPRDGRGHGRRGGRLQHQSHHPRHRVLRIRQRNQRGQKISILSTNLPHVHFQGLVENFFNYP